MASLQSERWQLDQQEHRRPQTATWPWRVAGDQIPDAVKPARARHIARRPAWIRARQATTLCEFCGKRPESQLRTEDRSLKVHWNVPSPKSLPKLCPRHRELKSTTTRRHLFTLLHTSDLRRCKSGAGIVNEKKQPSASRDGGNPLEPSGGLAAASLSY
jgi:hypothetical protein